MKINADIAINKFGIPIPFAVYEEDRVISLNKNNLIFLLNQFSDEDRFEIMNNYCFGCGAMDLPCHCMNDE